MDLTELVTACRNLTADKITERKKHATQLRQLLKKKSVIKYLDSNSGKFNWTDVLKDVVRHVNVESHALQKSRASHTGQAMANKKREVASLFKFVVEIANKRGPQLKSTLVVKHITNVLDDNFMCECYGQVYSSILLKHVLSVRKYLTEIPATYWLDLLKIYCSTFQLDETDGNHLLYAQLIYALIQTISLHTDLPNEDLLKFFTEFFQSTRIKKEKQTVVQYIMRSVNFFVKLVATESRQQMCKLGEIAILKLLYLWNCKNALLQALIVEFLSAQIKIHHPGGAKTEELGAFAADWDLWKNHLQSLYETIHNDLQDMASKHTFSSSLRENITILSSQYVDLVADVYHQVICNQDVEISEKNYEEAASGSFNKKRRLESVWLVLREEISSIGNNIKIIPWLQLIKYLLQKYPSDMSSENDFLAMLQLLAQYLTDSKRIHVTVHLLNCLQAMVPLFKCEEASCIWAKVWATCIRIGNLHLCKDSSYHLMSVMLHHSLLQPQKEIWNLFVPLRTSPTNDSVRFLATYCSYYDLPEQYDPILLDKSTLVRPLGSSSVTNSLEEDSYPLRKMLMEWLLPCWEDEGESDMALSKNPDLNLIDCDLLASVLISLIFNQPLMKNDCCHPKIFKFELSAVESTYLEMAFKTKLNDYPEPYPSSTPQTKAATNCTLDSVMDIFLEKMKKLVSHVLQLEEGTETLQKLAYLNCLLSKCLAYLFDRNIINQSSNEFFELRALLESTMSKLSPLLKKLGSSCVHLALPHLIQMFSPTEVNQELCFQHFKLLRSLTSYDIFLDIVASQIQRCKGSSLTSQCTQPSSGRTAPSYTPLDDDFDMEFVNHSSENDESDDEEVAVTDSDESQTYSIDLFSQKLSAEEQLSCQCLHFLCLWCSYDHFDKLTPDSASLLVRDHIENHLSVEGFDVTKAFHLQMIKIIISTICCSGQYLPGYNISYLLKILMKILKQHYRNQDIVQTCIELVAMVIPHLSTRSDEMVSIEMTQNRESILNIFNGICTVQKQVNFHSRTRLELAKCLLIFIQNDPEGLWTIDKSDESESIPMWKQFPDYLSDTSLEVRLFCARNISSLFRTRDTCGKTHPLSRQQQEETFQKVYECTEDCLNTQLTEFSSNRQKDERCGRIASLLHALSCVATSSRLCERNAIFTCCSHIQLNSDITVTSIQNVLTLAVQKLKYSSLEDLIISHLPFLINKWLTNNLGMASFPYQLLNCFSEADFYQKYPNICLPFLMLTKHEVGIEANLIKLMGQQWLETQLKQCILKLMVHILPYFAVNYYQVNDEKMQKKAALSTERYKLLLKNISKEDIEQNIQKRLSDQVVEILLCLEEKRNRSNVSDPSPNPPFYNRNVIMATLNYLTVNFTDGSSAGSKSLVYLLSKAPENFQKILQSLAVHLGRCTHLSEQYRALCRYELFVKLLLEEFSTTLGDCRDYVMREVIYRLLHTIKRLSLKITNGVECSHDLGYLEDIIVRGLHLVETISKQAIASCPKEFCKYLPLVIHALLPYSSGFTFSEDVLRLFKLVVIDNSDVLKPGIILLDPFPDTEVLRPLCKKYNSIKYEKGEFTLAQEIESFLKNGQATVICGNIRSEEGLKFLHNQLNSRTKELKILLDQCKSEHRENIVCQLVQELSRLVQSQSGVVAETAATCLGNIGPIDLSSWTSSSQHNKGVTNDSYQLEQSRTYQLNPSKRKYFWIFYWLNQYLVDSCLDTVQAASQVLWNILSGTKTGKEFSKNCLSHVDFLFKYLYPFVKKRSSNSFKPDVNSVNIDDPNLWNPPHDDHVKWIKHLTCSLISSGCVNDEILQVLEPICKVKAEFCELVLPYLIHNILASGKGAYNQILTQHINNFFAERCTTSYNSSSSLLSSVNCVKICMNKQSVQKMLDVVQYLRHQPRVTTSASRHKASLTSWDNNFWLDFNYSHIANAANFCSAHFSAILYSEIWWYAKLSLQKHHFLSDESNPGFEEGKCFLDSIALCSSCDPEMIVQEILLKAYREIGDPDGPYGCGAGTFSDPSSRIQTYEHENQWGRAAVSYDIALSQPTPGLQHGVLNALHKYGLSHVLETYLNSMENTNVLWNSSKLQELRYEAAWQAGQWNLNVPSRVNDDWKYHQSLYTALASFSRNQTLLSNEAAHAAKLSVIQSLQLSSLESCTPLYQALTQLTSLVQLSSILQTDRNDLETVLEKWDLQLKLWDADFEYVEPIQKVQCLLLSERVKGLDQNTNSVELLGLCTQYKQLIKAARKAGKYQVAERSLHILKKLGQKMDESMSLQIDVEESMLLWEQGEHTIAKHLMKTVISHLERKHSSGMNKQILELYSMALNTYGNWLAETRTENPRIIIESYLEKAVSLLHLSASSHNNLVPLDAFLSLACYSHKQYINTTEYMESTTFEAKKELMLKAQREAQELKNLNEKDCTRFLRTLERQSAIDEAEVLATHEDRIQYLKRAIINFIKCLRYGDNHDLHIFTLITLWFENAHSNDLNYLLQKKGFIQLKTSKFLPLMYQLAARMGCQDSPFYVNLNKIIERVTQDHPHHSLHIVMALTNAHKDDDFLQMPRKHGKKEINKENSQDRAMAAKKILSTLLNSKIAQNVKDMEKLCEAYIQLANFDVEKYKRETKDIQLPSSLLLTKLKNLQHVAVTTSNIPIDPSGVYAEIPYVTSFEPNFKLAGGINLPKIILCNGSNGSKYRQLVKGRDDLRQDAIMQQVFGLVNKLLDNDADARKRQLNICTYKVIPLSQRSGLLEWCEGTQPLGEYLVDKEKGAHQRYQPHDWSAIECRKRLMESPAKLKESVYKEICQNFHPVLRHFFFEKFFDSVKWYECRTAYVKSVATNSIVGYILGLGDRHVQNILINCETAQLVHIDLGVAFEQGRILPTPETVPFRLTRDIVDGMGVSGVEGIFRRCCEKTMLVMHNNQQSLLTILQVLLYDPLYNWTLSPGKAHQLQQKQQDTSKKNINNNNHNNNSPSITNSGDSDDMSLNSDKSENLNKVAKRVLLRLQQKLQGIEDGVQLSVAGQINHLIQDAQDPKNLCKLFPGWQPYI